jgi:raffinose/stachyose/melibiose transport system substrate-binding protein
MLAGTAGVAAQEPVEIEMYHLLTANPGMAYMQLAAQAYQGLHPNVHVNITVLENESLKAKVASDMAAGTPPDLFNSWGGGVLRDQVEAGMVQDITDAIAPVKDTLAPGALSLYQLDGKQYGIPYNFGVVGLWYNPDLLAQAGIEAPATTWEQFLTDVQTLKDAGITPVSLGGKDTWTVSFWWSYLAMRIAGQAGMEQAIQTGDWTGEAFVRAGQELKRLADLDAFQPAFESATHDMQQGTFGNGQAAYILQGQWTAGSQRAQSESKTGIPNISWAEFPTVEGGAGLLTEVLGGADGFSVGKDAPAEAVDFAKFLVNADNGSVWQSFNDGTLLPTVGLERYVTDPALQTVLAKRNAATFAQLYLDQATPPAVGPAINEAVGGLVVGALSPEEVTQAITDAAQSAG